MKKRNRIALLTICLIAFFVSAPAVVLYAMGYRLARLSQSQAVGVVYVATLPSDAATTIDGVSGGTTPRALTNLAPGEHVLTVQKDNYEAWQKTVPVEPNVVTQLRDIRLFPDKRLTIPLLPHAAQYSLAPDGRTVAVVTTDRHLHVLRQDQASIELFAAPLPFLPTDLSWSSDSSAVLLKNPQKSGYDVLDLTATVPRVLPIDILQPAVSAEWDGQIAGRVLFLNSVGQLRAYNIHTDATIVVGTEVKQFATGGRYIARATADRVELLDLQGQVIASWSLPTGVSPKRMQVAPDGALVFMDQHGDVYYLTSGLEPARIAERMNDMQWSPDGTLLLLRDDQHLSIYNASLRDTPWLPLGGMVTVAHPTGHLQNATWFAGSRYVVYQAGGELRLSDIDTRGVPVVYTIDSSVTNNAHSAVGVDGTLLYYLKQDTSNLVSLVAVKLAL